MKHFYLKSLLFCLLSMIGAKASAYDIEVKNADGVTIYYNWINNNTELAVTYTTNEYSGNVVIPESVTYDGKAYSVTAIDISAFFDCTGLTSVTIPNSITSIGYSAFWGCRGLTSVTIPNSVTDIGGSVFYGCSSLTSVTIPNSVTCIGEYAFEGCTGLTSVTIGNSVTSIGEEAFKNCTGLTSVTIPNSVTDIGRYVFYGCSGLTSVTFGESVTSIGDKAFYNCPISDIKVKVLDLASFCNNQIVRIVYSLFNKPIQLINKEGNEIKDYIIPDGVTSIGDYAFSHCTGLTAITIPSSVTSISYNAFDGCIISDIKVKVLDLAEFCNNQIVRIVYSFFNQPIQLINKEGNEIKDYIIPDGVTSIGDYVFRSCTGLTSVTIPNSVTSIGEWAFSRCSSLTSITFGNSVTSIGEGAFYNCTSLTAITIPNSVRSIGLSAFLCCI